MDYYFDLGRDVTAYPFIGSFWWFIIGFIVFVVVAIICYAKYIGGAPNRRSWLGRYFNFDFFYIERILKTLYMVCAVFVTVMCVFAPLGALFSAITFGFAPGVVIGWFFSALAGAIISFILIQFILRVGFEWMMMFIRLVVDARAIRNTVAGEAAEELPPINDWREIFQRERAQAKAARAQAKAQAQEAHATQAPSQASTVPGANAQPQPQATVSSPQAQPQAPVAAAQSQSQAPVATAQPQPQAATIPTATATASASSEPAAPVQAQPAYGAPQGNPVNIPSPQNAPAQVTTESTVSMGATDTSQAQSVQASAPANVGATDPTPSTPVEETVVVEEAVTGWTCPNCSTQGNGGNFCRECGSPRPMNGR